MIILDRFINFLKSFFTRPKTLSEGQNIKSNKQKIDNFIDSLQKDTQNHLYKKEILDEIDKNPNLIDSLSYTRLVQLNQLYEERIKKLEAKLKQVS